MPSYHAPEVTRPSRPAVADRGDQHRSRGDALGAGLAARYEWPASESILGDAEHQGTADCTRGGFGSSVRREKPRLYGASALCARVDSNHRPSAPEADALSPELRARVAGMPRASLAMLA